MIPFLINRINNISTCDSSFLKDLDGEALPIQQNDIGNRLKVKDVNSSIMVGGQSARTFPGCIYRS
jgi:hypothetical protein